jgi:DNA (cytosine-5)-methyltransferase 1
MQDPRGNLTLTYLGLADKLKPKWIVYENVPGLLSINGGKDFGSFLGALVELGYGFAYRVLDAQHFGVPQRRRRVFVVACLGDWRAAAEVLSLREGLRGYLEAGNKKRKGPAPDAGASVEAGGLPIWRAGDQANAEHMIDHAGTVSCNKGSHGGFIAQPVSHWEGGDVHPTLNQSAKGSGGVGSSNQELFSQGGAYLVPGEPIPFRKPKRACSTTDNESWVPADASNTLNNFDLGDTRTTHAVVQPVGFSMREDATNGTFDVKQVDTSLCLQALRPAVTSHHAQNIVVQPIAFDAYNQTVSKISQTVTGAASNAHHVGAVLTPQVPMAVRRLTPEECEALQGFSKFWSRIPWKGKPEEQCPDGPRYKACGNSMAVPVMRWIGERIAAVDATLPPNA